MHREYACTSMTSVDDLGILALVFMCHPLVV
jgi:hypothetical protein